MMVSSSEAAEEVPLLSGPEDGLLSISIARTGATVWWEDGPVEEEVTRWWDGLAKVGEPVEGTGEAAGVGSVGAWCAGSLMGRS